MELARLLLLVTVTVVQFYGSKSCLEEERRALLDIKEYLKFHNSSMGSHLFPSWVIDPNSDCCSWKRVTCNSSSRQVIHLSLYNVTSLDSQTSPWSCLSYKYSLKFSLFLSFKHLRSVDLSYNCFKGLIGIQDRTNKSTFTMLETLDLSYNIHFNQSIMEPLSALISLKNLFLRYCNIQGSFALQVLRNLELLDLSHNFLTSLSVFQDGRGKSTFTMLETLDLSFNSFNQSIMKSLSALTSLKNLNLASCSIEGPFPVQELSVLRNLELLDLSFNSLTNPSIFQDTHSLSQLKKLRSLNLDGNDFDNDIFKPLVSLPALRSLFLSWNSINGSLDDKGLCKMKQLQEIDLSNNMLTRTLDTCLSNLTSLRALDLSNNALNGSIPTSFFAPLASLEFLSLSHNKFEGIFSLNSLANNSKLKVLSLGAMYNSKAFQVQTENPSWIPSFQLAFLRIFYCQVNLPSRIVPTFLSNQYGLKYIDLSYNNLVGMLPNYLLANNPKLETAKLDHNSFTGLFQLPTYLNQSLDQLRHLELSHNEIQGKLPNNIGFLLPHLEYIDVSSNMFDDHIPASIGEMSNLVTLNLANNNFSGKIPKHILLGCISLESFRLSNNNLEGRIFPTPINLRSLMILRVDNNWFNGTLEDGLSLIHLRVLDISGNNLSGVLPSWIFKYPPYSLSGSNNNFEGAIPKDLCKNGFSSVDLSHNGFSGAIPSCLFTSSLVLLHLQGNSLTVTIPEILSTRSHLVTFDLSDNKFFGTIPKTIYRLSSLTHLLFAGNMFEGQIPSQICQLQDINILDLSHNSFNKSIPSCFNNMSFGNNLSYTTISENQDFEGQSFVDSYNYANFNLKEEDTFFRDNEDEVQFMTKSLFYSYKGNILELMSGLDLSSNRLIGEIPNQLGDLPAIRALNLSYNHLNGTIPKSLDNLKEIESLDLSNNNLDGEIPLQLQDLNFLSTFNVSYNNLSGKAPENGQFANFDESNYRGNPYLSWSNSNRCNAAPPSPQTPLNETESESIIDFTIFSWSFGASYVMALISLLTILWINLHWRRVWFYYITICLQRYLGQVFEDAFF